MKPEYKGLLIGFSASLVYFLLFWLGIKFNFLNDVMNIIHPILFGLPTLILFFLTVGMTFDSLVIFSFMLPIFPCIFGYWFGKAKNKKQVYIALALYLICNLLLLLITNQGFHPY